MHTCTHTHTYKNKMAESDSKLRDSNAQLNTQRQQVHICVYVCMCMYACVCVCVHVRKVGWVCLHAYVNMDRWVDMCSQDEGGRGEESGGRPHSEEMWGGGRAEM